MTGKPEMKKLLGILDSPWDFIYYEMGEKSSMFENDSVFTVTEL
jgi:hypothetical protein